jgi:MoaA/NifB/PqqE/SkfB family radical SAM enzyme
MKLSWPRLPSWLLPRTGWIQIEVTSRCNAACTYCPHTAYRENWDTRDLALATFRRLLPALARKRWTYLQGWGEPLLHPDFFTMARLAKEAGCRVGTTTNGMLLDARLAGKLVDAGLDLVAFSLTGLKERNDAVRRGTSYGRVLEAIQALNAAKARAACSKPQVNLAYLLLRSGLPDLKELPRALRGLGIDQVVVSTLDFVPAKEWAAETLHPTGLEEYAELEARLEELALSGEQCGLAIHHQLPRPGEPRLLCPENPQQSFFVSAAGALSPCVFTNLPVSGVTHWVNDQEVPFRTLTFGNIQEEDWGTIWRRRPYINFRRSFYTGRLATPCRHCLKL